MIICLDVDYRPDRAVAAGVLIEHWEDASPLKELVRAYEQPASYRAGEFYLRELPPLLKVLNSLPDPAETAVIDGYVWLGINREPGLGAYLYRALKKKTAVIGVAKSRFKEGDFALSVFRGRSRKPLYVTAVGMDPREAAAAVKRMHGKHRLPTILKRVDRVSRESNKQVRSELK